MTILSLILNADFIVQLVILLLILISILSWTIIFDKFFTFRTLIAQTNKFEKIFLSTQLFDQLYHRLRERNDHPFASVFIAAMNEMEQARSSSNFTNISERLYRAMEIIRNRELDKLEDNVSLLATIGSASPFIGLFGTVWGIMHSFQSIAAAKNTSLAIVAPGIAEALLATAIGLVAAIPAVICYNIFTSKLNNFSIRFDNFLAQLYLALNNKIERT